jgi:hypothetical protein
MRTYAIDRAFYRAARDAWRKRDRWRDSADFTYGGYDYEVTRADLLDDSLAKRFIYSCGMLAYGDYLNTGEIGAANVEVAQEHATCVTQYLDYGTRVAWLSGAAWRELAESLARYPSLDDDAATRILADWTDSAWADWIKDDLIRALHKVAAPGRVDAVTEDALSQAFDAACAETGDYPYCEGGAGAIYINVERLAPVVARLLELPAPRAGKNAARRAKIRDAVRQRAIAQPSRRDRWACAVLAGWCRAHGVTRADARAYLAAAREAPPLPLPA